MRGKDNPSPTISIIQKNPFSAVLLGSTVSGPVSFTADHSIKNSKRLGLRIDILRIVRALAHRIRQVPAAMRMAGHLPQEEDTGLIDRHSRSPAAMASSYTHQLQRTLFRMGSMVG
jgi:hypothetical protein